MTDSQDSNHGSRSSPPWLCFFFVWQPILDVQLVVGCWRKTMSSPITVHLSILASTGVNTTISKCYHRSQAQADLRPYKLQDSHTCYVPLRLEMNC